MNPPRHRVFAPVWALTLWIGVASVLASAAIAQPTPPPARIGIDVSKYADGALTLMAFSVVPDLAGSALSISSATTNNPSVYATQFGGGSLLSDAFPAYVEGSAGYSRYDPDFVATQGEVSRSIPTKWNTFAGTGGLGWGFHLFGDLRLIPIFNFSLGHVESDASLAGRAINIFTGKDIEFLKKGRLNAYGLGGSVILDYERFREMYSVEVQLRYTNIYLQTFDSSDAVSGNADAATASLYARLRAPIGLIMLRRPVRYVLEVSNSNYVGDQRGALGFNYLSSAGTGIELDVSAYHTVVSRLRYVFRYFFGENVSGYGGSISASF